MESGQLLVEDVAQWRGEYLCSYNQMGWEFVCKTITLCK